MKLLIVADLHYSLKQYDWLVTQAGQYDCVVIAGDLLDLAGGFDREVQSIAVIQYLAKISAKTKVVVCSGNHDGNWRDENDELVARWLQKARYDGVLVDGDCFEFGDYLISAYPWWDGEETKMRISKQLREDEKRRDQKWIWVYHSPPKGTETSWSGKADWGDECLRDWIGQYQPSLVFSGHVHQSPFVSNGSWHDRVGETWVFNTGREPGYLPSHIIFDTETEEAIWNSSAGREQVSVV